MVDEKIEKFKVLLCGEAAVGKTSLIKAFVLSAFEEVYKLTVGVDVFSKNVKTDSKTATLSIWDIGGQERFEFIRGTFYKGAIGVLLVFDLTRKETFDQLDNWVTEINQYTGTNPTIVLLGNKKDLIDQGIPGVETDKIEKYAKAKQFVYLETSAKAGLNVEKAFQTLTDKVLSREQ
jgi:small GTP-binding protein